MSARKIVGVSREVGHRPDYLLAVLVLLLIGLGMVMIYSTGSIVNFNISGNTDKNVFFNTQLMVLAIGLVGWALATRIHYSFWRKIAPAMFVVSLLMMVIVILPGISYSANGATRWFKLGSLSFQPVEFFKLSLIIYLSAWVEKNKDNLRSFSASLLPFLFIISLVGILVMVLQRDMGSAMVLVLSALTIYFLAGGPLWLFGVGFVTLSGATMMMIYLFPHRLERLQTFLNHQDDPTGSGYHIKQALIAIGSGGILGRGLGNSFQSYGYLPESTNDSIFAIIGEQFGLWGTMGVVVIFAVLGWRGFSIAKHAPDTFSRLVAAGITSWVIFQALINITAMLNLIPLTGVTLPFISYGGTSLLFSMVAIGILQNISKFTFKEVGHANRSFGRGNRRTYRAGFGDNRRVKATR